MRTERESLSKSHMFKTSVKKLGPLARQIAGKGIEDAIVQMRFSRKKVAGEVLKHLEYARDEAIVRRGMGLGSVGEASTTSESVPEVGNHTGEEQEAAKTITITEKSGKKRVIKSPSQIYVSQAWVGRGTYGSAPDHRARGQINKMRLPFTSTSLSSESLPFHDGALMLHRHNPPPQRRSYAYPPRGGARAEEAEEESLGPAARSAGYGAEAVLSLVDAFFAGI